MSRGQEILDVAGLAPELHWAAGTDPIAQASRWVPERLYKWQCDVIRDCMVSGARVATVTPNESGKTSVIIPVIGLSWMAAFPGSQVVSTAGVERQIKQQLWPVLKATLSKFPNWKPTDDLKIRAPGVRGLPGSEWEAFTTKDPKYAEGFHPRWYRDENGNPVYAPLLIIIDEAKAFNDPEMMFALVKRCSPDALLMISTPGEDVGPFYDALHKERDDPWKCHEITWTDCPHLREGFKLQERLDAIRKFGEDNPLVLSWVFGKFYRTGGKFIFDNMEAVKIAMSGGISWVKGLRTVAVEFSGGGDEQVFGYRHGNQIFPLEVFHEKDDVRLCNILLEKFKQLNVKPGDIVADNGGAGKTCIDILESKGYPGIRRYMFNGEAKDSLRFKFKSAEDHWEVKTRLAQQSLLLPDDPVLQDQMRKRKYVVLNDDNRIQMEPKEKVRNRGEDSPDRLDTVIMLCSDMEPMEIGLPQNKQSGICGSVEECMAEWLKDGEESGGSLWASGMLMEE